jgi:chemotaxis protein methyltransferase CheR
MIIRETLGAQLASWDASLLATDISARALAEARRAIYADDRVERLPAALKQRYLRPTGDGQWQVDPEVTQLVVLRSFNLMNRRFPFRGQFHAIFCRNVMIYFDRETREALVDRYVAHLRPGGWLFIGHSESIGRDRPDLEFVRPATFRKRGA